MVSSESLMVSVVLMLF